MLSKITLERLDTILSFYDRDINKRGLDAGGEHNARTDEINCLRDIIQNEIEAIADQDLLIDRAMKKLNGHSLDTCHICHCSPVYTTTITSNGIELKRCLKCKASQFNTI